LPGTRCQDEVADGLPNDSAGAAVLDLRRGSRMLEMVASFLPFMTHTRPPELDMGPSFITAAVNILPNSVVLLLEAFITGLPLLACHAFYQMPCHACCRLPGRCCRAPFFCDQGDSFIKEEHEYNLRTAGPTHKPEHKTTT